MTQIDELRKMGNNVHFVQHRQDLAAELSRISSGKSATHASAGIHTYENGPIKAKNPGKIKSTQQKALAELPLLSKFTGQTRAFLAFVGAILFVISDLALAVNRFASPIDMAALLVLGTYYPAQWLIALSAGREYP